MIKKCLIFISFLSLHLIPESIYGSDLFSSEGKRPIEEDISDSKRLRSGETPKDGIVIEIEEAPKKVAPEPSSIHDVISHCILPLMSLKELREFATLSKKTKKDVDNEYERRFKNYWDDYSRSSIHFYFFDRTRVLEHINDQLEDCIEHKGFIGGSGLPQSAFNAFLRVIEQVEGPLEIIFSPFKKYFLELEEEDSELEEEDSNRMNDIVKTILNLKREIRLRFDEYSEADIDIELVDILRKLKPTGALLPPIIIALDHFLLLSCSEHSTSILPLFKSINLLYVVFKTMEVQKSEIIRRLEETENLESLEFSINHSEFFVGALKKPFLKKVSIFDSTDKLEDLDEVRIKSTLSNLGPSVSELNIYLPLNIMTTLTFLPKTCFSTLTSLILEDRRTLGNVDETILSFQSMPNLKKLKLRCNAFLTSFEKFFFFRINDAWIQSMDINFEIYENMEVYRRTSVGSMTLYSDSKDGKSRRLELGLSRIDIKHVPLKLFEEKGLDKVYLDYIKDLQTFLPHLNPSLKNLSVNSINPVAELIHKYLPNLSTLRIANNYKEKVFPLSDEIKKIGDFKFLESLKLDLSSTLEINALDIENLIKMPTLNILMLDLLRVKTDQIALKTALEKLQKDNKHRRLKLKYFSIEGKYNSSRLIIKMSSK